MACQCYLGNVLDNTADGKTACEKIGGAHFNGPIIPFGAKVRYKPITAKDGNNIHQFGKKKLLDCQFLGYVLRAEERWSGDLVIPDYEDFSGDRGPCKEFVASISLGEDALFFLRSEGHIKLFDSPPTSTLALGRLMRKEKEVK